MRSVVLLGRWLILVILTLSETFAFFVARRVARSGGRKSAFARHGGVTGIDVCALGWIGRVFDVNMISVALPL